MIKVKCLLQWQSLSLLHSLMQGVHYTIRNKLCEWVTLQIQFIKMPWIDIYHNSHKKSKFRNQIKTILSKEFLIFIVFKSIWKEERYKYKKIISVSCLNRLNKSMPKKILIVKSIKWQLLSKLTLVLKRMKFT